MRAFVISVIVFINFILQSTLFQYIEILGVKPNTAILIIVSFAVLRGDIEGSIIGFFAGLLQDLFFGQVIGFYALLYALAGYICGKPFKDFFRENYIFPVVLTFISMICCEFIFYVFHFLLQGRVDFSYYLNKIILPETVYTMILSIPFYQLIYLINEKLEKREKPMKSIF